MIIKKSFKYELRLTEEQRIIFSKILGCCRYIRNKGLHTKKKLWEESKKNISRFELDKLLTEMKRDFDWLRVPPSQALQQVNKDLDQSFKNFFKGSGYPKFKKKEKGGSFRLPQGFSLSSKLSNKIEVVKLTKIGKVRFIHSREIDGVIKFITIIKKCNKWFVSFNCEVELQVKDNNSGTAIGIDRGIAKFIQCSDGVEFSSVSSLKKSKEKLAKLQRKLAKQKNYSSNWRKIKRKISKLYFHVLNKRKDYTHKISTQLAKNHSIIVMENLNISGMTKSAKGTLENPGKNVRAKSGLNRSILDQGWYMFQKLIEYKMHWRGGKVIYIDPKYTSQKCSKCNHISKENRKSQAIFECVKCGYESNADLNASKNILAEGHSVLACGEEALASSLNQELKMRKPSAV